MSEFHVEVVQIKNVKKHPNADTLSVCECNGYPLIFRTGDYQEGDLAVHVPVDSIVPDKPEWAFLDGHFRIKAKRLRGIFSMGLLAKANPEWKLGQNVQTEMGITKYEPTLHLSKGGENEVDPGIMPVYTDIEGLRKYKKVLKEGEQVVLTEKCHGCNARYTYKEEDTKPTIFTKVYVGVLKLLFRFLGYFKAELRTAKKWWWAIGQTLEKQQTILDGGRLWVGSHNCIKRFNKDNVWWKVALDYDLKNKLKKFPGLAFYGEVYGQVQDLKYGVEGTKLVLFDILDLKAQKYLDREDFLRIANELDLPTAPPLYEGPWSMDLVKLAEGKTTFPGADHVREGFVVKPVKERYEEHFGRVILKMVGEGYLLRKEG